MASADVVRINCWRPPSAAAAAPSTTVSWQIWWKGVVPDCSDAHEDGLLIIRTSEDAQELMPLLDWMVTDPVWRLNNWNWNVP